jgi:hypothetical protein
MTKYFGFGFLASALGSAYMFIRALSNGFSSEVGLCLTRGGQACLQTSNPVWTASTLKWLAPLIFIISIVALFLVAVLGDNGVGFAVAFGISIGIIALALDNEIKDKSQWLSPIFRTIGHTLLGS